MQGAPPLLMEHRMKKILLFGLVGIAVSIAGFIIFKSNFSIDQEPINPRTSFENTAAVSSNSVPSESVEMTLLVPQSKIDEKLPRWDSGGIAGTPAEEEVVRRWEQERGYLLKDRQKNEEYKSYDIPALQIMVDSGDVLAQAEIVRRAYGEARTREIYKALAMGSTSAVMSLGVQLEVSYEDARTDDARQNLVKELFAVYEMGALRGDRYNQIVLQNEFIKKHNIQLTEEDKKAIKQRGKELYNEIQQQRFELGLDEFDNSVPPEVSNYYNNLYKFTYEGAFRD